MSDPLNPTKRLLSALDLGPSWARDAVPRPVPRSSKSNDDDQRVAELPPRRDGRQRDDRKERSFGPRSDGPRDPRRDDRRDDRRSPRNDRQGSYRSEQAPQPEFIIPAPGIRVQVEPNADAIHLIAKEVVHVARVYSLFDIAKTLMSQRERFHGIFTVDASKPEIYHGHRDNSLWLTKEEAVNHFWTSDWRGDLYEEEEVEIDGPSGNFQVVAKCGLSGVLLGPPNYHAYQSTIRQVHREKFPTMPFDRYAARIVTERNEEAVQAWLHTMKTKLRWRPVGQEEAVWLEDRKEVEQHFLHNRFPEMYVATRRIEIPAITPARFISPSILIHLKKAAMHAANHPAIIIPTICTLLEKEHLPVFKKQGKLFGGPSRPHPIPDETNFSERPSKIVDWMREHPETKLSKLWNGVLPEGEKDPTQEWLADLFWLLSQGHILLFADDTLILPLRRPAPAPEAPAKKAVKQKEKRERKKKPRKRRKPNLLLITKRVAEMEPQLRKNLRGFDRTISHRLRLKTARAKARRFESSDDSSSTEEA